MDVLNAVVNFWQRAKAADQVPYYQAYREGAERQAARMPIDNPTPQDITLLAPYMSEDAAAYLLRQCRELGRVRFAGPPVFCHGTYQAYGLDFDRSDCVRLHRICAYAASGVGAYTGPLQMYSAEAMEYAEKAGDAWLLPNTHMAVLHVELIPLPASGSESYTKFTAACAGLPLQRPGDVTTGDEPLCEVLDDAILAITNNPLAVDELSVGKPSEFAHFCGKCGGGLQADGCTNCPARGALGRRRPWSGALPKSLAQFAVQSGYKFAVNPLIARAREHLKWASAQLSTTVQPDDAEYKSPRRLDMGEGHVVGAARG